MTAITYVNPAVAVVAGALVLGEPVTVWTLLGFALILLGCALVTRPDPRAVATRDATVVPDVAATAPHAAPPRPRLADDVRRVSQAADDLDDPEVMTAAWQ